MSSDLEKVNFQTDAAMVTAIEHGFQRKEKKKAAH